MKRFLTAIAAIALATSTSGLAFAQPHAWHKGDHVDHDTWGRGAVVDYHAHHLRRPPRGYEWRQVDNNYVLAAAATGLVASVIAASR